MTDPTRLFTDRGYLAGSQYATGSNLAARQSIYAYAEPKVDLVTWALEQVEWSGDERTLDVGCGNGVYLRHLAQLGPRMLVGADLSAGMVREVVDNWPDGRRSSLLVADVQQAPFVDGCFDVALAMHMLYHVPDMTEAARELRRVVRPGGTVLAVDQWRRALAGAAEPVCRRGGSCVRGAGGAVINRIGAFRIGTHAGAFVCRRRRCRGPERGELCGLGHTLKGCRRSPRA